MAHEFYKLFQSEADRLSHALGIILPKTRKEIGVNVGEFIEDIISHRVYLNKSKTIWIQPCHYYTAKGDGLKIISTSVRNYSFYNPIHILPVHEYKSRSTENIHLLR